jgi:hypothetical protein
LATLVTNAFSLVAALAWSDAIQRILKQVDYLHRSPIVGPLAYALMVSVLAYFVTTTVGKLAKAPCTSLCPADAK